MNRSDLLLGIASVLAGIAVLMAVLGAVYNLLFALVALPFGAAAYFIWYDATGRLAERTRRRAARRERRARRERARARRTAGTAAPDPDRTTPREAREVLGVDADADEAAIRTAYRERVKEVHPDSEGGDEEAFKRVNDAYERLVDR